MVVIGAGVVGLATAQRLAAHGVGVEVLEARTRIGGRIWTIHRPGLDAPVELGAEFLDAEATVGWWGGPQVWRMAPVSHNETVDMALSSLAAVFGMSIRTLRAHLRASFSHDWLRDPYARGACSYIAVGGSSAPTTLARPAGKTLFFAGEHASGGRNGTVDGAIASGYRAAEQVLRLA